MKKTYGREILGNLELPCLAQATRQAQRAWFSQKKGDRSNDFKLKILFEIRMNKIGTLIFFKLLPFNAID